jgi:hypothetical protein
MLWRSCLRGRPHGKLCELFLTQDRSAEFTTELPIHIYAGTFNVNGKTAGIEHDLSDWLRPTFLPQSEQHPELVVVGFQEIVELSPQQIMATDPARKTLWERALLKCLNRNTEDPYVPLRGGQLVGAALLVFVRSSVIGEIKNVEGSLKKVIIHSSPLSIISLTT